MDTGMLFILAALAILFGGAFCVFFMTFAGIGPRKIGWTALACVIVASVLIMPVCSDVLTTGNAQQGRLAMFHIQALHASLQLRVDRLSAFFMIIVLLLALPAVMFSIPYVEKEKDLIGYYAPLILFVLGMLGVLVMDDLFFFFIPWEFMSLSAYALILFEKDDPNTLRAGLKFFIVTHFGTTCMFIGAIVVYFCLPESAASFSFQAISESMARMTAENPGLLNLALVLLFVGFATKAGVFPFGFFWLPDAHPAAPSPVSALLSGVMIKIGVYGLVRIFLFLLPPGAFSFGWGWTLAVFGCLSLFFGTLKAMMQHDSKVLLAYHSIGQMGYILLALGLGMVFAGSLPVMALAALIAGLYHLVNHACFKGLLFLNAGAVLHQTGMRDMDKLGGLSKLLPVTSIASLVAVCSIGGLPGFSGFASKWMIYQASLFGGTLYPLTILMGLIAIFISVVTIVSVFKFYAAMFLGPRPASLEGQTEHEDRAMQIPQLFLALLCVLLGIVPVLGILPAYAVFEQWPPLQSTGYGSVFGQFDFFRIVFQGKTGEGVSPMIGVWNPLLTMIVFGALVCFGYLVKRSAKAPVREVETWCSGSVIGSEETIYRSSSYYRYLKECFGLVNTPFVPSRISIKTDFSRILNLDRWVYDPFSRGFVSLSRGLAKSHAGIPHVYLLWTVAGAILTVALLFWLV